MMLAKQRSLGMFLTVTILSIALLNVALVLMVLEDLTSTVNDTPSRPALS